MVKWLPITTMLPDRLSVLREINRDIRALLLTGLVTTKRVYTKRGNGTETTYTYDKQRERLQVMKLTADGQTVMEDRYRYDAVDNILGITNAANPTSLTKLNKAKFTFVLSISVLTECMSFVIRNCNKK